MSDLQKQALKKCGRNFLILCGFILLVYGMIKSTLVLYTTLAVIVLAIVGGCAWSMITSLRWDWRLRGKLTESEYKAYQVCDRMFSWGNDKYQPTEEQIKWIAEETEVSSETLWSMYNKLTEGH